MLDDGFSSAQAGLWQQSCDFLNRRTSSTWELKQERKNWAEMCENIFFPNYMHTASVWSKARSSPMVIINSVAVVHLLPLII